MGLYHKDIGFPRGFKGAVGRVHCMPTMHAMQAAKTDRYGDIKLPNVLNTNNAECIEAHIEDTEVLKLVYRVAYDDLKDLVLAVIPKNGRFIIKTVWLNLKSDTHKTLNRGRYAVPK